MLFLVVSCSVLRCDRIALGAVDPSGVDLDADDELVADEELVALRLQVVSVVDEVAVVLRILEVELTLDFAAVLEVEAATGRLHEKHVDEELRGRIRADVQRVQVHRVLARKELDLKLDAIVLVERVDGRLHTRRPILVGELSVDAREVLEREVDQTLGATGDQVLAYDGLIGRADQHALELRRGRWRT